MAKFIAIMLSTTKQSLLMHTSLVCNKNIIIPIGSLKGHHIWASYLGIIFANNKSPLVLSASAAKRGKLACNQLKKELAVHECIPNYTTFA
jgi:hypothetical protein